MLAGFSDLAASTSNWEISSFKILAITSKKRPVPAAHLSFITKLTIRPSSPKESTLASWPPISITVLAWGQT
jgi:hypothetical protein